jgi:hypothetical protein
VTTLSTSGVLGHRLAAKLVFAYRLQARARLFENQPEVLENPPVTGAGSSSHKVCSCRRFDLVSIRRAPLGGAWPIKHSSQSGH